MKPHSTLSHPGKCGPSVLGVDKSKCGRQRAASREPQPAEIPQGEYRDTDDRKKLIVQRIISSCDFVPEDKQKVERIEGLSERICVEWIPCAFSRRPEGEMKVGETGQ